MSKELVLSTKDFNEVGISAKLTSNDLVEVVATDIYEQYLDEINKSIAAHKDLCKEYWDLFNPELLKMKVALGKYFKKADKPTVVDEDEIYDDDEFTGIVATFGKVDEYWPYINGDQIKLSEKDKGTLVETSYKNFHIPNLKSQKCQVKLSISSGTETKKEEVNVSGIKGEVETTVKKSFTQVITVPIERFKKFQQKVKEHNKQVAALLAFLPKSGLLSVDRFTREARVKMNKKIISAQSPDFREKISKLFNIKL